MSKKKKAKKYKSKKQGMSMSPLQTKCRSAKLRVLERDASFWTLFEVYNQLDAKLRMDALKKMGIEVNSENVLKQLTKSHFVIPGKTRYQCQKCGECCRYARKIATFTYEPCPYLDEDNLCTRHDNRYQVCKWFPFWLYPDKHYGYLLTIKPYCTGYGKGELVNYEATVTRLAELRASAAKEPDGAHVTHEVIYLPTRKEWVFPSKTNVDELMAVLSKKGQPVSISTQHTGQLAHAQRYTSGLLGKQNDPHLTIDEHGSITDVNEAACLLCSQSRESLIGTEFSKLFVNPDSVSRDVLSCLSRGKATAVPQRLHCAEDITVHVLLNAMVYRDYSDGLVHGILVSVNEVSPVVFQELTQSRSYARGLLEANLDALVVMDCDGVITDVNKATVSITGCLHEELLGSQFKDYFDDPLRAQQGIDLSFKQNEVRNYELNLVNSSGELIPVSFNATVYRSPEGVVQGVFASARHICETMGTKGCYQVVSKLT